MIDYLSGCYLYADKEFIRAEWQTQIFDITLNLSWTPKRTNQYQLNSPKLDRWLSKVRERIEGVFHEIQNVGRNIERLHAKTFQGLFTCVIAKITNNLLQRLLLVDFGVNVQNLSTNTI